MNQQRRFAMLFVTAFFGCGALMAHAQSDGPASPPDSFVNRLSDVKHVGLGKDANVGGYVLHLYTSEQYTAHLASLGKFREERQKIDEQLASIETRRREAQRLGPDELTRLVVERKYLEQKTPSSPFDKQILLHKVVHLGLDYVELSREDKAEASVIIPVHKICKVFATPETLASGETAGELSR